MLYWADVSSELAVVVPSGLDEYSRPCSSLGSTSIHQVIYLISVFISVSFSVDLCLYLSLDLCLHPSLDIRLSVSANAAYWTP